MSTVYYPDLASNFAMKIGDQGAFERLGILAWRAFATNIGLTFPYVRKRIQELAKHVPDACVRARAKLAPAGMDEDALSQFSQLAIDRAERTVHRLSLVEAE